MEAIDLNREMQLRQSNKSDVFQLLVGGMKLKQRSSNTDREEMEDQPKKVGPADVAEKEFYRIVKEVRFFYLQNKIRKISLML